MQITDKEHRPAFVAGAGFEPVIFWVMSPALYR